MKPSEAIFLGAQTVLEDRGIFLLKVSGKGLCGCAVGMMAVGYGYSGVDLCPSWYDIYSFIKTQCPDFTQDDLDNISDEHARGRPAGQIAYALQQRGL